ncbi:uncharacterized protein LOC143072614 [Mytilus galloprovincialis]|uniref:uncharacterized protein LOC143072614 n=1 Tax=Mytilus galloprovincialis TaxID=29158 RepID=UPI003F7CA2CC
MRTIFRQIMRWSTSYQPSFQSRRFLMDNQLLNMNKYFMRCEEYQKKYDADSKKTFVLKMSNKMKSEERISHDDLQTMIHLVRSPREFDLCVDMARSYQTAKVNSSENSKVCSPVNHQLATVQSPVNIHTPTEHQPTMFLSPKVHQTSKVHAPVNHHQTSKVYTHVKHHTANVHVLAHHQNNKVHSPGNLNHDCKVSAFSNHQTVKDNTSITEEAGNVPINPTKYQNSKLDIGSQFMRMLHHFKKAYIAIMFMEDRSTMRNFLYNNSVIDVYMDLLFKTEEYEKVVRTYEEIDYFNEQKLTNHMTLVMAALYNLNTQEALEKAVEIIRDKYLQDITVTPPKARAFAAALALRQDDPNLALNILQLGSESHSINNINSAIRVMALAKLDKVYEAFQMLDSFHNQIGHEGETFKKPIRIYPECLNALNDMVKRNSDPEILEKFTEMKYNLREAGLINCVTLFQKLSQTLYSNPPNICKCELNEYFTSDRCTPVHKIKVL